MSKSRKIPESMRVAAIERFGGPEELKMHTLPVPSPSAREVLIAVDTVGVGTWDLKIRDGAWAEEKRFPMILGVDGAGVIAALGARVRRFHVGERVYAYSYKNPKGGFGAEYVAIAASKVGAIPARLDLLHAGAVTVIGLTALQGVDDALKIQRGETLLVHGASGNVGSLAVQFAKWRGARVLATASGRRGVSFVRKLGVDKVIDGRGADIVKAAEEFAPDGLDAVLAFTGGKELNRALSVLRRGGRVAYPNGIEPEPKKRKGISMQPYDAQTGIRPIAQLTRAIEESELEIPLARIFPLEDAAKAHRWMERGHVLGKVVLRINRDR